MVDWDHRTLVVLVHQVSCLGMLRNPLVVLLGTYNLRYNQAGMVEVHRIQCCSAALDNHHQKVLDLEVVPIALHQVAAVVDVVVIWHYARLPVFCAA